MSLDAATKQATMVGQMANVAKVTDIVVMKAEGKTSLSSRWDPHNQIDGIRGHVGFVRQQQTGRENVIHREKVKLTNSTISWYECNPRHLRSKYRPRIRQDLNATRQVRHTYHVNMEDIPACAIDTPRRNTNDRYSSFS